MIVQSSSPTRLGSVRLWSGGVARCCILRWGKDVKILLTIAFLIVCIPMSFCLYQYGACIVKGRDGPALFWIFMFALSVLAGCYLINEVSSLD